MKNPLMNMIAIVSVLGLSQLGQAEEVCGRLTVKANSPSCHGGIACPHIIRLEYRVGARPVTPANDQVRSQMEELKNTDVCVDGPDNHAQFLVTEIHPQ